MYNHVNFCQSNLLSENNFTHAFFTKKSYEDGPIELQKNFNLFSNIYPHTKKYEILLINI